MTDDSEIGFYALTFATFNRRHEEHFRRSFRSVSIAKRQHHGVISLAAQAEDASEVVNGLERAGRSRSSLSLSLRGQRGEKSPTSTSSALPRLSCLLFSCLAREQQ